MLGYLLLRRRRGRPAGSAPPAPVAALPEGARRVPLARAAAIGLAAAVVLSVLFAIRAGVFLGPLVAVVLWRGIGARLLTATAGVLLGVALPIVYLALLPARRSGVEPRYPIDLIAGHWVAVGAWTLLALALWRTFSRASRPGGAA
jgi:arabinofuranan 3-O-arabinosyltransferase